MKNSNIQEAMGYLINRIMGLFRSRGYLSSRVPFADQFIRFQKILSLNNQILELTASIDDKLGGNYVFDQQYIRSVSQQIADQVYRLIYNLNVLAPKKYQALYDAFAKINREIEEELSGRRLFSKNEFIIPTEQITREMSDLVGLKNANLAEVRNALGMMTPEGFVITTRAFLSFLEYNQLQKRIGSVIDRWNQKEIPDEETEERIQSLVMAGAIPPKLKKEIRKALKRLAKPQKPENVYLALRSSGLGEDSEHTFAGQHLTLLNEPGRDIFTGYKAIVASMYSISAMEYRRQIGFSKREMVMAVACQTMIDPNVAGVLNTLDPVNPENDTLVISSSWGLGAPIMSGRLKTDKYLVDRDNPRQVVGINIVRKKERLSLRYSGGIETRIVPDNQQTVASLSRDQIDALVDMGLTVERYFKKSQEIEFAFDQQDHLIVLQVRPIHIKSQAKRLVENISVEIKNHPVIFSNKGEIAQKGVATGRVFLLTQNSDLKRFPQNAILVAKNSSPQFARVTRKANAIITDTGSATGHMATIAREFRVPTIVGTEIATSLLKTGQEITLDAEENVVYEGIVKNLAYLQFVEDSVDETYEYRLLRRVLKKIEPLNLIDPDDRNFKPSACRSFHDILRFVHEKAVEELTEINYNHHHLNSPKRAKLKLDIPLDLTLINISDGFTTERVPPEIGVDKIASVPMLAFLRGVTVPGAWNTDAVSVDFGSFISSVIRTPSSGMAAPKEIGQNLSVISKEYMNTHLRLGYHFNIIDAYVTENINDNYAYFRFMGGVTEATRRYRRARFLAEILEKEDFRVEVRKDLVVARIKKLPMSIMKKKLGLLGLLVAFTRQLDVFLTSESQIGISVNDFNALCAKVDFTSSFWEE